MTKTEFLALLLEAGITDVVAITERFPNGTNHELIAAYDNAGNHDHYYHVITDTVYTWNNGPSRWEPGLRKTRPSKGTT